jgi:hypothetical protein
MDISGFPIVIENDPDNNWKVISYHIQSVLPLPPLLIHIDPQLQFEIRDIPLDFHHADALHIPAHDVYKQPYLHLYLIAFQSYDSEFTQPVQQAIRTWLKERQQDKTEFLVIYFPLATNITQILHVPTFLHPIARVTKLSSGTFHPRQ